MADLRTRIEIDTLVSGDDEIMQLANEVRELGSSVEGAAPHFDEVAASLERLRKHAALADLFGQLSTELNDTGAALAAAREEVERLEWEFAAGSASAEEFAAAQEELSRIDTRYAQQAADLERVRQAMEAAGLDTANLAEQQRQLAADMEIARARAADLAEAMQAGLQADADRDLLGLNANRRSEQEIEAMRAAYERLRESGNLTAEELEEAAQRMEERIRQLTEDTETWAASFEEVVKAIAGVGTALMGLKIISEKAIEFESAMADVKKVTEGTDEQFAGLATRLKEMSTEIPISAAGLAEMAAAGGQLGIPIENLEQFVVLSAKMSTAFNMSADEAGKAVAKLTNVFGLELKQVEALGDAINVLGNTTAASEADIINVLTRIGGASNQFGLSAQQAAALAASMLSMGVTSEVAGTGINALLSKLQTAGTQSEKFQTALARMGLSAEQLAQSISDNPQKALTEFLKTLKTLDDNSRAEVLSELFGTEFQDDIARMLNGLEGYDKALKDIGNSSEVAGAMTREFQERLKTTEAQLKLLKGSFDQLLINLGEAFLPAIRGVAQVAANMADLIAKFAEAHPNIAAVATAVATMTLSIGAMKLAFNAVKTAGAQALTSLTTQLHLSEAAAGKLKLALGGIGAVLAGLTIGWSIGEWLREEFEEVERFGIAIAASLTKMAARANAAFEMMKAPFTDDTIADAAERLTKELQRIDEEYAQIAEDAHAARKGRVDAETDAAKATKATADAMGNLSDEAGKAGAAVGKTLDELKNMLKAGQELSALDLSRLSASLTEAYYAGKRITEEMAELNRGVLLQSFEQLGVNGAQALGQVSKEAKEVAQNLMTIDQQLRVMGGDPVQTANALATAISGAIEKSDSAAALDDLRKKVEEFGKAGQLSAKQVEEAFTKIKTKSDDLTEGINSAAEALRKMGITSDAELKQQAAAMKEMFDAVVADNSTSLRERQEAFKKYAEAAIEANKGVADSTLKVQASMQQMTITVDASGKAMVQSMKEAAAATSSVGDAAEEAAAGFGVIEQSVRDLSVSDLMASRDVVRTVTEPWLEGERAASRYARQAREVASQVSDDVWNAMAKPYDGMIVGWGLYTDVFQKSMQAGRDAAAAYVDQMENLDERARAIHNAADSGVADLQMRLLEINGTEEQIARARLARDKEERNTQIQLLQIEIERARLDGDTAAAEAAEARVASLRQELALLDQIYAAEREKESREKRKAEEEARAEAKAQASGDVNINIGGVLDVNDKSTLETLTRKLAPILGDLGRRGAM